MSERILSGVTAAPFASTTPPTRPGTGRKPFRRTAFKTAAAVATGSLLLAGAGVVHADIVRHLDTVATVAKVMPLNVGGANGTTTLVVDPTNNDGKQGCNLTGGTTLTLNIASSNTSIATVSPSTITFTSCGDEKTLTVTPVATGSVNITAAIPQGGNTTAGTFNLAPAAFTVNVAPPANTAPTLTISGAAPGDSYPKGSVPPSVCNITDAEDGPSSKPATLSAITGPNAADGIGSQTASCSYTDAGGLNAASVVTYSIIDPTPPAITPVLDPAAPDGNAGWYKNPVALTWTVTDPESPSSLTRTGCENVTVTADQAEQAYLCSATSAGGSAGPVSVKIKKDGTAPTVSYTSPPAGTLGANGWYTSDVTATFAATDALSGPASAPKQVTTATEGAAVKVDSPEFSDVAGNNTAAGAASATFKIDKTAPTATFNSTVATGYFGSIAAEPTCTAADSHSGPGPCVVTGYSKAVGTHTLTATATDLAGNTGTKTETYTVHPWTAKGFYQPVDMPGATNIFNTVKGGSTVPVKFELFAGTTEITDPAQAILKATTTACPANAPIDEIEVVVTGNTTLRYDATSGQFIYNWKTPAAPGTCYKLIMTGADGSTTSTLSANFKLK